jgi:hypothetical protein
MDDPFIAYRDRLISRHQTAATNILSTVADVVIIGGLAAGVATRRVTVGAVGFSAGAALAVIAHFFQPGTVRDEVTQVLRRPIWAVRAESHRIFGRSA